MLDGREALHDDALQSEIGVLMQPALAGGAPARRPWLRPSSWNSGSARSPSVPGVRMNVGATALTVIP